jgi:hypothetical protein
MPFEGQSSRNSVWRGHTVDQNYNNFHLDTMGFLFILARLQLYFLTGQLSEWGGGGGELPLFKLKHPAISIGNW